MTVIGVLIGISIPLWILFIGTTINWLILNNKLAHGARIDSEYVEKVSSLGESLFVVLVILSCLQIGTVIYW